jgi:protein-L-isoaspartate O-methyltransferase
VGEYLETPFEQRLAEARASRLDLCGRKVLEIGCGAGYTTAILASRCDTLVVVDQDPEALQAAEDHCLTSIRHVGISAVRQWHLSSWEEFQPDCGLFSDVVLSCVLEHVADPVALLQRTIPWLIPDGCIHIIVPNAGSLHRKVGVAMGVLTREGDITPGDTALGHERVYGVYGLLRHVIAAGLKMPSVSGLLCKPMPQEWLEVLTEQEVSALFAMGAKLPVELCAELYVIAQRQHT